ncbi:phage integrase family protein [mine drainage metagenome]|uniref:Phage integrase family protein n=1 Tax=mine drainage metagenome TaxID=410659 RepID=A0A1J5Q721_9ZZZZ
MEAKEVACADRFVRALRDGLVLVRSTAGAEQSIHAAMSNLARLRVEEDSAHTLHDGAGTVLAHLSPDGAHQWAAHLEVLADRSGLVRRARTAFRRSGIKPDAPVGALTDRQWAWLWRGLDPDMPRRLRDRAYVLVGVTHARRHAELQRLNIEDIRSTPAGFHITYVDRKNRSTIIRDLHHAIGPDTTCSVECGACALQDLLDWEAQCMGRTTGPAFATRYAGTVRPMTRQNGRHRIREATRHIADQPWGSTRSLRAGAATSAWEAGWSVEQIAREVTGHNDLSQADLYIRRLGTPAGTIQLDLTPSTRNVSR